MMFLVLPLLSPSCKSIKEDPLYLGTWQFKDKIQSGDLVFNTTRTLTLTRHSYEETYIIQRDNSSTISAVYGTKGDLLVSHSVMTFILKEIGTCIKDASDKCTSAVQFFGPGTQFYTDNIQYYKSAVVGDFEADENNLWLTRDSNGDGDTEDSGENIEFTRI